MNALTYAIEIELDEIVELSIKSRLKEVIHRCTEILEKEEITPEESIRAKLFQGYAEHNLGLFGEAINHHENFNSLAKEAYEESKQIDNLSLLFDSILFSVLSHFYVFKREKAYEISHELEKVYDKLHEEDPILAKQKKPQLLIWQTYAFPFILACIGKKTPEDYIEKSIQIIPQVLKLAEKSEDMKRWEKFLTIRWGLNFLVLCYRRIGDIDKDIEYSTKLLNFSKKMDNRYNIAYAYGRIAKAYYSKGEYEKFLDLSTKELRVWEELDNKTGIMKHHDSMGLYYSSQRDYDKALEYFEKPLKYFQEINNEISIAWSSWNLGLIYRLKGELDLASEYLEKAYVTLNEKKPENWWGIFGDLSLIYSLKGEIEKALQIEQEGYKFHINAGYSSFVASSLFRMSQIYWQKGEKETAIEKAQENLKMYENSGNSLWIGEALANLIFFYTEIEEIELASTHLQKLEKINRETKERRLNQSFNFSEALVLKKSVNPRDRMRADLILENLLREDIPYDFHVKVLLTLCVLLILELHSIGEKNLLNRLQKYVLDLYSLASTNNSFILTAETLMLQAKLALVELDSEKAKKLLEQASRIAEDKGLERLKIAISQEKELFKVETSQIKDLDLDSPITERMEIVSLDKRMNGIKKCCLTEVKTDDSETSKKLFSISI